MGVILNYYDYICQFEFLYVSNNTFKTNKVTVRRLASGYQIIDRIILSQFAFLNQIEFQIFVSTKRGLPQDHD